MSGYAILMFIFGLLLILSGIYIYTGHDGLLWRGYYKKASKEYLRYLGKVTMLVGLSPIFSGIVALFVDENSIIPMIVLLLSTILMFVISIKFLKK